MKILRFHPRAQWVWRPRGLRTPRFGEKLQRVEEEANRYLLFRRVFTLKESPRQADVVISVDGRYRLFVNGQGIGRGPARCFPEWQYVDPYDLTPYLKPGENVLAVIAHSYGKNTAWYELPGWEPGSVFGCGGFFFQGEVVGDGEPLLLDTPDGWRCREAGAWQRNTPTGSLGYMEIFDAGKFPADWLDPDFDDHDWQTPEVLQTPARNFAQDVTPFPFMTLRDIPYLREEARHPAAVIASGEVQNAPAGNDVAAAMMKETLRPLQDCRVEGAETLLSGNGGMTVSTTASRSVSLTLDFGEIVCGRVHFDVSGNAGAIIEFSYGERRLEDGRVRIPEGIPGFDAPPGHRYILREGRQQWEQFEWAGFRYLQITVRHAREVCIHRIGVTGSGYPVEQRGSFSCSDKSLTRLWQTGANTVRLCMHDAYIDCPSREQRQWVGDGYVQMLANFVAFGDAALAAKLLCQTAQSQLRTGLTTMAVVGDFSAANFTNIPDFTLYWIMELEQYLLYTGDTALVEELFPSVIKAVGWFEQFVNEEHLLTDVPHWIFIDWAELDKRGQITALNCQFVRTLEAAAVLADVASVPVFGKRYRQLAKQMRFAINKLLWDKTRGLYVDCRQHGKKSRRLSQQSNAAAIAFDVAPHSRRENILRYITEAEHLVLTRWSSRVNEPVPFEEQFDVVMAQPFYCHHLHHAFVKAGKYHLLFKSLHRWKELDAEGNNTFRETWQSDEITSLCHGWSATPTYDLSTYLLGIKPTAPGFRKFAVTVPADPFDMPKWAKGAIPSPVGDIPVSWQWKDQHIRYVLTVPGETQARVIPPVTVAGIEWELTVDGNPVTDQTVLLPGEHEILLT